MGDRGQELILRGARFLRGLPRVLLRLEEPRSSADVLDGQEDERRFPARADEAAPVQQQASPADSIELLLGL